MKKLYANLEDLIISNLNFVESNKDRLLFEKINVASEKKYLTKTEFYEICMWKSPRPKKYYLMNTEETIENISSIILSTIDEKIKIDLLDSLKGVSIPTASAILTLINPRDYGIIDIRVWQVLYLYGYVNEKSSGINFSFDNWLNYLTKLRRYANKYNITARTVEQILFKHHLKIQEGKLYDKKL
ncbi:MAG: hypothetical protein WC894_05095 [Patescibacteria group bacterium]